MSERTEALLKQLEGWGGLDLDSDVFDQLRAEQEKEGRSLASLFHQAYVQNDAGRIILDIMIRTTIMKPTVMPGDSNFQAGIREGRCDMVRQILANIELAESE